MKSPTKKIPTAKSAEAFSLVKPSLRSVALVSAVFACVSCTSLYKKPLSATEGLDTTQLESCKQYNFDHCYKKPNNTIDLSELRISQLSMTDIEIDNRRLEHDEEDWQFTAREIERLTSHYKKQVNKLLTPEPSSDDQQAAPSLGLSFELLKFIPNAPKDDSRTRIHNEKVFTRGVGDLQMRAKIYRIDTGEVLLYIEDTDTVGSEFYLELNDRVNNARHFRLTLNTWIRQLKSVI